MRGGFYFGKLFGIIIRNADNDMNLIKTKVCDKINKTIAKVSERMRYVRNFYYRSFRLGKIGICI